MPLDTDIPNADERLTVEFYTHKLPPYEGKPFVRIVIPGDQTNVIDQPVREDHKRKYPRQWLYFQMQSQEGALPPGTPLADWHKDRPIEFNEHQLAEMQVLKFQVVEQIAQASDRQLERVGMGGIGLREKARAYLAHKNKSSSANEITSLKEEIEQLKALMAGEKRGPGRPRKDQVNDDTAATSSASHG